MEHRFKIYHRNNSQNQPTGTKQLVFQKKKKKMKTRTLLRKTVEIEIKKDKFILINKKDETNYCFPLRIQTLDNKSESESDSVALTSCGVTPISTEAREEEEKRSGRV